jgi:hypothetical protein
MEKFSRRDVLGVAAGTVAGAVAVGEGGETHSLLAVIPDQRAMPGSLDDQPVGPDGDRVSRLGPP